jgi:hypothetical protein
MVRRPDAVVAHDGELEVPAGLMRLSIAADELPGVAVINADIADAAAEWPEHDPARLGATLRRLA